MKMSAQIQFSQKIVEEQELVSQTDMTVGHVMSVTSQVEQLNVTSQQSQINESSVNEAYNDKLKMNNTQITIEREHLNNSQPAMEATIGTENNVLRHNGGDLENLK